MSDFFDRLEHQLRGAVTRAAEPASTAAVRRRRIPTGGLGVALASAAGIAVAVVLIVVTGHGRRPARVAAPTASACTRKLFDGLGVLRRPQTAADRAFTPPRPGTPQSGTSGYAPLQLTPVPGLTRLAATLPGGHRLFFVVYAPPSGLTVLSGDEVSAYLTGPGGSSPSLVTEIISGAFLSILDDQPPIPLALPGRSTMYLGIVPDRVARVVWTFPRQVVPTFTAPGGKVFPRRVIPGGRLTAAVRGNVAVSRPTHLGGFPSTTWLAADGRIISRKRAPVIQQTSTVATGTQPITETATGTPVPLSQAC